MSDNWGNSNFYEKGAWTPTENVSGRANITGTFAVAYGAFRRVDDLIIGMATITGMNITVISTRTTIGITSLPYLIKSNTIPSTGVARIQEVASPFAPSVGAFQDFSGSDNHSTILVWNSTFTGLANIQFNIIYEATL